MRVDSIHPLTYTGTSFIERNTYMKYRVFQNHSIREAIEAKPELNGQGWTAIFEYSPAAEVESNTNFEGSEGYDPAFASSWKHKADIEAESLSDVFRIGNIGPEEKITRYANMRSISVGDIIVNERGMASMVDRFGFDAVDFTPENIYGSLGALI